METTTKSRTSDWLIPAGLVVLSLIPAAGGAARLGHVAGDSITADNARFVAAPLPIVVHILTALVYSMLGAFQFAPRFRRRHRGWHRAAGKILVPAGFFVAVSGLWMTLYYPWPPADGVAVYLERLVFGSAMLVSIALGVEAIRQRRFTEHGHWMIRAYAIGLGAGTQVLTHLPWFVLVDLKPDGTPRAVMMGLGWVINILVAEWIIRRGATKPLPHSAPRFATAA